MATMNNEMVEQVNRLAQMSMQAKVGDISTLAELMEQVETLRQTAQIDHLQDLIPPMEALEENIKELIMGNGEEDDSLRLVRDSIDVLAGGMESDRLPTLAEYPVGLNLIAESTTAPQEEMPPDPGNVTTSETQAAVSEEIIGDHEGAFAADEELLGEYLVEQRHRLEEIEGNLLLLERETSESALAELRRALHTIKGDSGFLGLSEVVEVTHAAESYLDESESPVDLEAMFAVKDWLAHAFEDLTKTGGFTEKTRAQLTQVQSKLGLEAGTVTPEVSPEPSVQGDQPLESPPSPEPSSAGNGTPLGEIPEEDTEDSAFFPLTADESLLADFISESREHLELATAQLLSLEGDPENEEAINSVFRAFHTVKGIAGFLNLDEIQHLAHDTENLLDQVRRKDLILTATVVDLVFEALDWMTRLIGNVSKGLQTDGMVMTEPELTPFLGRIKSAQEGAPVEGSPEAGVGPAGGKKRLGDILVNTGVVAQEDMEDAIEEARIFEPEKKVGEVLVEKKLVSPKVIHNALNEQRTEPPKVARGGVELKETLRVDYERLEDMIDTIGELVLAEAMINQDNEILKVHSEDLSKKLYNLSQVSRKLQELGTTIRMIPISGTFQKMARLVRDLSRKSGKNIAFVSQGDETELDRAYVDLVADPLVHMIRNAVDHGIESPEERIRIGKPEQGRVELRAFHEGGNIHVEVNDDGQGLDPEKIVKKALEKELISQEDSESITNQEIFQMIFLPGFSTATQVTEVSGRGVGMDVVRRNIKELRGQVTITSEKGGGTSFKIILPLTLALIDGMLVRVGAERFIFPVLSVVESTRPTSKMINTVVGKGEMISLRSRQLPLYRLNRIFEIPDAKENITESLVVIVEYEGRQIGIAVDDLIGMQQTVIKSLGAGLFEAVGLSGGSIMADGKVGLIVDVPGLIAIAQGKIRETGESVI